MKKLGTRKLVLMALLVAISIILARFFVFYLTSTIRISFGSVPIILAGLLLGPVAGGITGAVADILGATLFSPLGYYPPLTLPAILVGVIPALLKPYFLKEMKFYRMLLLVFVTKIVTSIGLTTLLLSRLYGNPFLAILFPRVPVSLLIAAVEAILVFVLYKRLHKEFD